MWNLPELAVLGLNERVARQRAVDQFPDLAAAKRAEVISDFKCVVRAAEEDLLSHPNVFVEAQLLNLSLDYMILSQILEMNSDQMGALLALRRSHELVSNRYLRHSLIVLHRLVVKQFEFGVEMQELEQLNSIVDTHYQTTFADFESGRQWRNWRGRLTSDSIYTLFFPRGGTADYVAHGRAISDLAILQQASSGTDEQSLIRFERVQDWFDTSVGSALFGISEIDQTSWDSSILEGEVQFLANRFAALRSGNRPSGWALVAPSWLPLIPSRYH